MTRRLCRVGSTGGAISVRKSEGNPPSIDLLNRDSMFVLEGDHAIPNLERLEVVCPIGK